MLKILVPVDGSETANRAVAHVIKLYRNDAQVDIHLLNVQIPIDSGHARLFVSADELEDYHREEGIAALAGARRMLDEAGVPYTHHIAVGHVADTIIRYAKERGIDKIVLGSHGRTALLQVLLGSVAQEVLKRSDMPVTLVKPASGA
ncbi:universal stress protein [Aromatoleum sp.]|uniref:universal stress protein n=1 Tax=Aromatoleum sp. TaxID=2307007 RepID=UPI002FC9C440